MFLAGRVRIHPVFLLVAKPFTTFLHPDPRHDRCRAIADVDVDTDTQNLVAVVVASMSSSQFGQTDCYSLPFVSWVVDVD